MSKKKVNLNKEIIALFSGQSSTITTPKLYLQLTGSLSLAVVLNQIIFWSNKSSCDDGYFYKKYEEWFDEIHIPERTLRRRFDVLEERGWIYTKVKMVLGKNIKHIKPDMDKIIESISDMLEVDKPISEENNNCSNIAPTGQTGRSESAKVTDPTIYTEENKQNTTTRDLPNTQETSSSSVISKEIDKQLLDARKGLTDERDDEEFLKQCKHHLDESKKNGFNQSRALSGLHKIIRKGFETPEGYIQKKKNTSPFSDDDMLLIGDLNHAIKIGKVDAFFPNKDKLELAKRLSKQYAEYIKSIEE